MIFWKNVEDNTQSSACEISEGSLEVSKDAIVGQSIFWIKNLWLGSKE